MESTLNLVKSQLGSLRMVEAKLDSLSTHVGAINERLLRPEIERSFGRSFAREVTINSLQSLAWLISKGSGVTLGTAPSQICEHSKKMAQKLEVGDVGCFTPRFLPCRQGF